MAMSFALSKTPLLILAVTWLVYAPSATQAAQVNARLDPNEIYLGTQTLLVVDVQDGPAEWPTVEPVDGVEIRPYGQPSLMQDLFAGTVRRSYRFLVSPARVGTFSIPAVTVQIGQEAIKRGPFTLQVKEAAIACIGSKLEPEETIVGRPVTLTVEFQGHRPGARPILPRIEGLTITLVGGPQTELGPEGKPQQRFRYQVTPSKLGTFKIEGIKFADVPAHAVTLTAAPFVIVGARTSGQSLSVGEEARIEVYTLGLAADAGLTLVAPPGLKVRVSGQPVEGPSGTMVFIFTASATEPGSPTIRTLKLADGRQAPLKEPISFSVRQAGKGGILSFTGKARSDETALGEPFIVDYDVFFRGDWEGAAIDLANAAFADKAYIKVEPVNDLSYPGWTGNPVKIGFGPDGQITALLGGGEFNKQKEQRMRFAVKITPLAAGELPLGGLRVIVQLQTTERQGGGGFFSMMTQRQRYDSVADLPPHRVVDPRGKKAPAGYRGAVGSRFEFVTTLDRTTAAAMSPLTLTMKITGESVDPRFQPPALREVADLARDFEVSSTVSGGEVEGNTITFTQTIRPRSEQVRELPALPLVFYNYQKQQYETVYSLPIPIEVRSGSVVGAQNMQVSVTSQPQPAVEAAVEATGSKASPAALGANFSTLGSIVRPEPLGLAGLLLILIGGPAGVALLRVGYVLYLRRRPASEIRRQRARLLGSLDGLGGTDRFHAELAEIVQAFLRLTFGLPPGEVSADDLGRLLDERRGGSELRTAALGLLAECDAGRFAVGVVEQSERERLIRQAREVLTRTERLAGN